jgi:hypothetical protein
VTIRKSVISYGYLEPLGAEAASGCFREASVEVIETSGFCRGTVGWGRRT